MKKKLITSALLLSACFVLAGCSEDSGETLKGQTDATMGKNVKHVKDPAMSYTKINHSVTFNGEKINFVAKYGIEKRYVHNWRFTNTEKVILSLKPVSDNPNLKLGINNVYSDVSISSSKTQYNAVRQDSVNLSYSQLPHGMVSISKNDGYTLPFQVESINENDDADSSKPLDPTKVEKVHFIHAFGQNHVDKVLSNDDPLSPNYGKEQAIVLRTQNAGYKVDPNGTQTPNTPRQAPRVIDQSRYWHISLDKSVDDETGTSILTRCQDQLKAMDIALESTGKMLREFTFKFYKSDQLMEEGDDDFKRDKREISQVLNTEAMAFGHSQDSIEKVATPTGGIDLLYNFVWQQLSAACGIPKSVLTGEQAGTLAGASQDVINYYDSIKAIQTNLLKPEIEQITRILMYANGDDPDQLDWKIVFNDLQTMDDKTNSEIFMNQANAYSSLISNGVLAPDEVHDMLAGQDTNPNPAMQTAGDSVDAETVKNIVDNYQKDKERAEKHDDS